MSCKIKEYAEELQATAKALASEGKGILAVDESTPTCGKRLADIGVENTEKIVKHIGVCYLLLLA